MIAASTSSRPGSRVEVLAEDGQFPATGSVDIFFIIGVEDETGEKRLAALQALPAGWMARYS